MTTSANFVRLEFLFELPGLTGLGHRHRDRHTDERSPREELRRRSPQLGQEGPGQFLVTAFDRQLRGGPRRSRRTV